MNEPEKIYRNYIRYQSGKAEIEVKLKGIRCVHCINAIEKRIQKILGVLDYRFNLTFARATFVWDPEKAKLQSILSAIRDAGFDYGILEKTENEENEENVYKFELKKLIIAVFLTMNLMLISISLWAGFFTGMEPRLLRLFHFLSFVLTTPVIFYSGSRFLYGAFLAVKNCSLNMDFQVAFNALLIYGYSIFNVFRNDASTYFESAAMFVTFILGSKYLESEALRKMRSTFKSANLKIPRFGRLWKDNKTHTISCDEIQKNMELEALPGDAIPADGEILTGDAEVDESSLTGEYLPVFKTVGDRIYSGTFLKSGRIKYSVLKKPEHSTFVMLSRLLEKAMNEKSINRIAINFFHKHFTNLIALLSAGTFVCWYFFSGSPDQAILNAIAVFIIACPCALALATPLSYLSGFRLASKNRILMKSANNFETLSQITDVVFDKTGTLTEGKPVITAHFQEDARFETMLFSLISNSRHLISKTLKRFLRKKYAENKQEVLTEFKELPGKGLVAKFGERSIVCGSLKFMREQKIHFFENAEKFLSENICSTLFFFAVEGKIVAGYAIEDKMRNKIPELCKNLTASGKTIHLTSGDRKDSVQAFVANLNDFEDRVYSEMSPRDKKNYIQKLQADGKKILFVGDGLNDSPAMVQADLSISVNGGIDLAMENADLIFLENNPELILKLFPLAETVLNLVKNNLRLSIGYNFLAILLAVFGFVIPPVAAASMSFSSLLVVGNSLKPGKIKSSWK